MGRLLYKWPGTLPQKKFRDSFHWPGLKARVKNFCQRCPEGQQNLAPWKPTSVLLIPLPAICFLYEWIGMDLVGPLPKSTKGHEYILVIVDYFTWYSEAAPLWEATSKNIAKELVFFFSHVGLPKELLTDQGTPFISKLLSDVCQQIRPLVYLHQTNDLV